MKDLFKGFYNPNETELTTIWTDSGTIFVFDTNVLLDLYQYEAGTKKDFLDLILSIKDRVWIPHQVALEYQRNRLGIIHQERDVFKKIEECFNNFRTSITTKIINEHSVKEKLPELADGLSTFLEEFNKLTNDFKDNLIVPQRNLKPEVRQHDEIRDFIDEVFSGKVSAPFDQSQLDNIYAEGEVRYSNLVPPGFEDVKEKKEREYKFNELVFKEKFGDLILWKQLIDKVKTDSVKKVVFVTRDSKKDWWYIIDKKVIGPLEDLQTEFFRETNADIFKMYLPADFMQDAKKYINAEISQEAIQEVENQNKASTAIPETISETSRNENNKFLDWLYNSVNAVNNESEKSENELYKNWLSSKLKYFETHSNHDSIQDNKSPLKLSDDKDNAGEYKDQNMYGKDTDEDTDEGSDYER